MILVDQTAPGVQAPWWQRVFWLAAEVALSAFVVAVHGSLIRPAFIYLLPISRAFWMFGQRLGLVTGLSAWVVYSLNVGFTIWPDRLNEFPNYYSFFLGPYVVTVLLTLGFLGQASERRKVQALYEALQDAHEQLQLLHEKAQELAVTRERNRLAREIHDSLAHYLTVINVQLEAAEKLGDDPQSAVLQRVRLARRLALECLQEVRQSITALRAATLEELSLPRALRKLVQEFTESTGIDVDLKLGIPEDMQLSPEAGLALFRAAQEGLTNVQRHAKATSVTLVLNPTAHELELVLQDNGEGPKQEHVTERDSGFGLLGLRERVALLGGQVTFGPADAGGARLAVTIPVRGAA